MPTSTAKTHKNKLFDFMGKFNVTEYDSVISPAKKEAMEISRPEIKTQRESIDFTDHIFTQILENFDQDDIDSYNNAISVLGYNMETKRIAVLVQLEGFREQILESKIMATYSREDIIKKWKRKIVEAVNSFFSKNSDIIVAYVGDDKFVILKAIDEKDENNVKGMLFKSFKSIFMPLKTTQIEAISIGFGNAYFDVTGWCESIKEAGMALRLGTRLYGNGRSFYFNDFGILYAIADGDAQKKSALASKILERLGDKELLTTLRCFLEQDLNATDTAVRLKIHRNTVLYRLDQISIRTGLDPKKFDDAFKIRMALYIREICS